MICWFVERRWGSHNPRVPGSAAYPRIPLGQLDLLEGNWEEGSVLVEAAMQAEAPGRELPVKLPLAASFLPGQTGSDL